MLRMRGVMRGYVERMEWLNKFKEEGEETTHEEYLDSFFEVDE
jgi:hypothetical protein